MFGPHWEDLQNMSNSMMFLEDSSKFGIIPQSIETLFSQLFYKMDQDQQGDTQFTVYCSFIQIYNEKLYDLFQDKDSNRPLVIREDKFAGIFVEGQSEYLVRNA